MTIESFLTRELDIRFIDARNIATQAKLNLGIQGYPSKDQAVELRRESMSIFEEKSQTDKASMRCLSKEMEAIMIPVGSLSSRANDDNMDESNHSTGCDSFATGSVSSQGSKFKLWSIRRR